MKRKLTEEHVDAIITIIGMRLKNLRGEDNQDIAAARAGMHRSKYSAVERGQTHYRIDAFIRVLMSYDIDILSLFESRPESQPDESKSDPIVDLAVERLRAVLLQGGDEAKGALYNVTRWFDSLPQKR